MDDNEEVTIQTLNAYCASEFGIGINVVDVVENGRIVMGDRAEKLRENPDIKDFYLV